MPVEEEQAEGSTLGAEEDRGYSALQEEQAHGRVGRRIYRKERASSLTGGSRGCERTRSGHSYLALGAAGPLRLRRLTSTYPCFPADRPHTPTPFPSPTSVFARPVCSRQVPGFRSLPSNVVVVARNPFVPPLAAYLITPLTETAPVTRPSSSRPPSSSTFATGSPVMSSSSLCVPAGCRWPSASVHRLTTRNSFSPFHLPCSLALRPTRAHGHSRPSPRSPSTLPLNHG